MAYDTHLMSAAWERWKSDNAAEEARRRAIRTEIIRRVPRAGQIDTELRTTAAQIIAASLRSGDTAAAVEKIKEKNLALQSERRAVLQQAGYAPDALNETPICPQCNDSGYVGSEPCECLLQYYVREQNRELSKLLNIGSQSFDTFDMDFYSREVWADYGMSPYDNMDLIRETCYRYAHNFGPASGNLFLTGTPGLGKTFLSACIAKEVSASGFSVVYDTATHIFSQFELQKFRRGSEDEVEQAAADLRRYRNCDLLIIDDLGTELVTPFVQDALYQIINSRLVSEKKTIINSNLSEKEIRKRYFPQIASRLGGEYQMLKFFGSDIRKLRHKQGS